MKELRTPEGKTSQPIAVAMKKVSLVVSLTAIALMAAGLVPILSSQSNLSIPGQPVVPLGDLLRSGNANLAVASAGILLLALLPSMEVLLALWRYARRWDVRDTLASLTVLVELIVSMRTGGG